MYVPHVKAEIAVFYLESCPGMYVWLLENLLKGKAARISVQNWTGFIMFLGKLHYPNMYHYTCIWNIKEIRPKK